MKKLVAILFVLILIGCTSEKETKAELEFVLTDTYRTFPFPDDFGRSDLYFQSLSDQYFFLFDYGSLQLLTYSIPNGKLLNSVKFEREGPEGVGSNVAGIFVQSPDEIYLTTAVNTLYKFDGEGNLVQKSEINLDDLEEKGISLFSNIFIPGKDGFYFAALPMQFDWTSLTPEQLTQTPNLMRYDTLSRTFTPISYFPQEFVGDNLNKSIFPLLTLGPDGMPIVNMNFRDIYRIDGGKVIASFAGHSGFPNDPPTSNSPKLFEDMDELMKMINHVDIYSDLFYLESQDLMVRAAKFEDIPENVLDTEAFMPSRWGLVFLDSDYNKVGELELEADRFYGKYIFGDKDGIWVSTDHQDHPDFSEDFLRFQLIEVRK
ncbi:DUF4221 family protein [Algoriphagus litoralis]|uniref:DUF4221 family protein n=1 Tax=Algoriphagus litoralis TaxID=2202829 RepID=UPI000DB99E82|nr:DUF4221 family protein [Algoriphagus litoralis]